MRVLDRNPIRKEQDTLACRHWKPAKLRLTINSKLADKQTSKRHRKKSYQNGRIQMLQQQQNQNKQHTQHQLIIRKRGRTKL